MVQLPFLGTMRQLKPFAPFLATGMTMLVSASILERNQQPFQMHTPEPEQIIILQVVLAPVMAGAWLNMSFPGIMRRLKPFAPLLAAGMTVLVSASIVAQNAAAVKNAGLRLVLAVACLHLGKKYSPCACLPMYSLCSACVHEHESAALPHACMMRSCLSRDCRKENFRPYESNSGLVAVLTPNVIMQEGLCWGTQSRAWQVCRSGRPEQTP